MIYYILYSFAFLGVWGLLLLKQNDHLNYGVFLGLLYTFYSPFFIQKAISKENNVLKSIKLIGPLIYLISNLIINFKVGFDFLLHPINIAFFIFILTYFVKGNFPGKAVQFFMVFFIYIYSFSLFHVWQQNDEYISFNQYDFSAEELLIGDSHDFNIFSSEFLNSDFDTVKIPETGKFVLIETWNEKCFPCITAIEQLPAYYKSISESVDQYYVYEPSSNSINLDYQKVFSFEKIKEKNKIIIDEKKKMYQALSIRGYPYFLLFDEKGNLIFKQIGFSSEAKIELIDSLNSYIKQNTL